MDGDANRPCRPRAFYLAHLIAALTPAMPPTPVKPTQVTADSLWSPSPGLVTFSLELPIPA